MTPAERLLAAAELLDKRAREATEGPWATEHNIEQYHDGTKYEQWGVHSVTAKTTIGSSTWATDVVTVTTDRSYGFPDGGCDREDDARYIATMHPKVGKMVAASLRSFGIFAAAFTGPDEEVDLFGFDDALALADLILAGAE